MVFDGITKFIRTKVFGYDQKARDKALCKCRDEVSKLKLENAKLKEKVKKLQQENSYLKKEQERFGLVQNYEVEFLVDFLWKGHNRKGKETEIGAYVVISGVVGSDVSPDQLKDQLSSKSKMIDIMKQAGFKNVSNRTNFSHIQVGDNSRRTTRDPTGSFNVDYVIDDSSYNKSVSDIKRSKNKTVTINDIT